MTSLLPVQFGMNQIQAQPKIRFGNNGGVDNNVDTHLGKLPPSTQFLFLASKKNAAIAGQDKVDFSHIAFTFIQLANVSLNAYVNDVDVATLLGPDSIFAEHIGDLLLPDPIVNKNHARNLQEMLAAYSDMLVYEIIKPDAQEPINSSQVGFSDSVSNLIEMMAANSETQGVDDVLKVFNKFKSFDIKEIDSKSAQAMDLFNDFMDDLNNPEHIVEDDQETQLADISRRRAINTTRNLSVQNPFLGSALVGSFEVAGVADAEEAGIEHFVSYLLRAAEHTLSQPKLLNTPPDELDMPSRAGLAVVNALFPDQLSEKSVSPKALVKIIQSAKKELDQLVYTTGLNPEGEPVSTLTDEAFDLMKKFTDGHSDKGSVSDFIDYLKGIKSLAPDSVSYETMKSIEILEYLELDLEEAKNNPVEDYMDEPETAEDFEILLEERKAYYEETDAGKNNYKKIKGYIEELDSLHPQESGKYLERLKTIFRMPTKKSEDNLDLKHAKEVLDNGLYGLEDVKRDALKAIAAIKTQQENNAEGTPTIIALLGPPGIGKTAISKLIAKAMNREFAEIHMGGVNDAHDLKGHSFTYQGAQEGNLARALMDAGTTNPVILMDEVGRLTDGSSQGDPSGPLINITDPTKECSTTDDYMGISFTYKDAVVVMTANDISRLPAALKDRIKLIDLNGYGDAEKSEIGKRFLLTEALEELGYDKSHIELKPDALTKLIEEYVFEPGVRSLKRKIKDIVLELNLRDQLGEEVDRQVDAADLEGLIGPPDVKINRILDKPKVGYVNGLATFGSVKGEIFPMTVTKSTFDQADSNAPPSLEWAAGTPGKTQGNMTHDSLAYVLNFVKSDQFRDKLSALGYEFEQGKDIKLNFQVTDSSEMDGPSAGAAITTALVSRLTGRPVRSDVAMTGSIVTGTGGVGVVGGIPLKVPAARKGGATVTFIPKACEKAYNKDFTDAMKESMPKITYEEFKAQGFPQPEAGKMWVIPVDDIDNVLEYSLLEKPENSLPGGVKQTPEITVEPRRKRLMKAVLGRVRPQPRFGGGYNVPETALGSRLNQVS